MDKDGDLDLVVLESQFALGQDGSITVFLNDGLGTMVLHSSLASRAPPAPSLSCWAISTATETLRPGLRTFVVRGACFGSQPTFATVQISESSNPVHVYQGTDEPEIYFPGAMRPPPVHKRPMLLLLEEAPGAVLATTDYGGDRVLRWFHPSNSKWFPSSRVR